MKYHQIQIDDEVFEFLKRKAEPLIDTPNSVLRRELLQRERTVHPPAPKVPFTQANDSSLTFPFGTPVALQHTLEVIRHVLDGTYDRGSASHYVARKHGVAVQTVNDKYGRQLGITAKEFDRLLQQPGLSDLRTLLIQKYPSHGETIRQILGQ
jgi:hypothetical protein